MLVNIPDGDEEVRPLQTSLLLPRLLPMQQLTGFKSPHLIQYLPCLPLNDSECFQRGVCHISFDGSLDRGHVECKTNVKHGRKDIDNLLQSNQSNNPIYNILISSVHSVNEINS